MATRTLCEIFYHSVETYRKPDHLKAMRDGSWRDISSEEFRRAVEELSMGLRALGVEKGDRVALLSENRPEWAYADLATLCVGAVDVPIYPNLPSAQVLYVLNDSQAKVALVSTPAQARKLAEVRAKAPHLRHVIRFDEPALEGTASLAEVRAKGASALAADREAVKRRAAEVQPDDLATLIYTSGTTGDPKGVMLVHSNIVSNMHACLSAFGDFGPGDTALSFLPLCHIFERMGGHYLMLQQGVTIAYAESVDRVPANMVEVRPTLMLSVPRLYEKMYARVREKVAGDSALRQRIFRWALGVGRRAFQARLAGQPLGAGLKLQHALADRLAFAKIRARTGGRVRLFVSGGAPLAREIAEFFGAVGLTILEGYGLTETSPVIAVNMPGAIKPNKPEATAEAIDAQGWFHTGDVGHLDEDGFLVITDRKKDIIVTSGGKKVAPQPIENVLKTNPLIAEIVMIGNKRNFPSALVVPNFDALEKWAREHGVSAASHAELVADPRVVELYDRTITELTGHLAQFERIKKVALLPHEFTLEAGELTPTLKVKRRVVEQKYKDVIDRLYEGAAA
ncbi:MAG: long-chain fatty acid--CoA ligase [Acidobacteria bacterium]|nr:MAG: long-chain fatty acid--CoA ligase [Acidobacteriota bacterium]